MVLIFPLLQFLTHGQHSDIAQRIDSLCAEYNRPHAPGLSVRVLQRGQWIHSEGFGLANLETNQKNCTATVFGVASIANQFNAACIRKLEKEGRISLDDDVRKYTPEFPGYHQLILIRHLLNHTSGIRNYHAVMEWAGFDYDTQYHDNLSVLDLTSRQYVLNHPPGEKVIYGNTAYTLLSIIIHRITQ